MSETAPTDRPKRRFAGLLLALALSLGLLLATASQVAVTFVELTPDLSGLSSTLDLHLWSTPLGGQVVGFVAAQLLVHLVFGLLVWLLARGTAFVLPRLQIGIRRLTAAWFGVGVVWVLVANATLYPWSNSGIHSKLFLDPILGQMRLFDLLTLALAVAVVGLIAMAIRAVPPLRAIVPRALAYGAIIVAVVATVHFVQSSRASSSGGHAQPNIILIGIDSLRPDVIGTRDRVGITPNLDAFMNGGAHELKDAITPLARTYPAWMSILSGQYPRTHGIRENLTPRPPDKGRELLPDILRRHGYHTFYATDEVRFSNIDASYGFDTVVTPTIGAADFLLGAANDLPLPNLLANTAAARVLFPATYANRAASHTYRPSTFTHWLRNEIEPEGPQMLAIHLTLPHWPYRWADREDQVFDLATDRLYQYLSAVIAADRQFGEVMRILENKGLLENALVVVLSDHGEALGMARGGCPAARCGREGDDREFQDRTVGPWIRRAVSKPVRHVPGRARLRQGRAAAIPVARRARGARRCRSDGARSRAPAGIRPSIRRDVVGSLAALGGQATRRCATGASAVHRDRIPDAPARCGTHRRGRHRRHRRRILRDEPGERPFRSPQDHAAAPDGGQGTCRLHSALAARGDSHRVRCRSHALRADRSARRRPPRRLVQAPDAQVEPDVARLWAAFHEHYGDELLPPLP